MDDTVKQEEDEEEEEESLSGISQSSYQRKIARLNETSEQRRIRIDKDIERRRRMISRESADQRRQRLDREAELKAIKRQNETPEERKIRQEKNKIYRRWKLQQETPEERRKRLDKDLERRRKYLQAETPDQRRCRLNKDVERRQKNLVKNNNIHEQLLTAEQILQNINSNNPNAHSIDEDINMTQYSQVSHKINEGINMLTPEQKQGLLYLTYMAQTISNNETGTEIDEQSFQNTQHNNLQANSRLKDSTNDDDSQFNNLEVSISNTNIDRKHPSEVDSHNSFPTEINDKYPNLNMPTCPSNDIKMEMFDHNNTNEIDTVNDEPSSYSTNVTKKSDFSITRCPSNDVHKQDVTFSMSNRNVDELDTVNDKSCYSSETKDESCSSDQSDITINVDPWFLIPTTGESNVT